MTAIATLETAILVWCTGRICVAQRLEVREIERSAALNDQLYRASYLCGVEEGKRIVNDQVALMIQELRDGTKKVQDIKDNTSFPATAAEAAAGGLAAVR